MFFYCRPTRLTLISSASNNLCADATSTISIASSSNPRHLDIYTPEIEVSTLGDTNAFIEMRSGTVMLQVVIHQH